MVSNLLFNAVTHGDTELPVEVSGRIEGGTLEVSFRNGGRPIPPESIAELFIPFKRGDDRSGLQRLGLGV